MDKGFEKVEYLKLLKKKQSINEKLTSEDSNKCLDYSIRTEDYLSWLIREHYLELLEKLEKGEIKTLEFCVDFENTSNIMSDVREILESNLIVLSPNEKSFAFADLLEEIYDECEAYLQTANADARIGLSTNYDFEKHEMELKEDEVSLKKSIKETYLKIQKLLKED